MDFSKEDLQANVSFKTSRSGGKGGQNVNKVSSKAELNYDLERSPLFNEVQKERIREKLAGRLTSEGLIQVISEEERSQYMNKERCLIKLFLLLKNATHIARPRKATRPSKTSREKRLQNKQQQAIKKLNRRKDSFDF